MAATVEQLLPLLLAQDDEHAIMLLNPAGRITGWFGAAERLFGYTSGEALGQPLSLLFTPEDVEKKIPEFELNVARLDRRAEDDRWMRRKDGQRFWATGILLPLRGGDGEVLGFGKVLRNRTDLKTRLEALERQVDALSKANDRKNLFISTLAHELRNPLSAVATSLELLNELGARTDEAIFARSTIRRQIDFMQRLINDLLDLARADAGKMHLNKARVQLNAVLSAAVETCRPALDSRTHQFALVMTDAPITIEADADRLKQVFVNLLENAAKHTEYGGSIYVKAFVEGPQAVVKIQDSGIGISPEMMPLIFDLFTQAEFSAGHSNRGLGLGLSVVKDIVTLHGGSVEVRSDGIGRGSEFTVRLPLDGPMPIAPTRRSEE